MIPIKVLSVRQLTKRYQRNNILANDNISFDLKEGEIFGLLGPNGAGKTTLVRQLMGLIKPTSGSILLFGQEITQDPHLVPCLVSYMAQRPMALADLRVREALAVTGHLRGLDRGQARRQGDQLIQEFGLEKLSARLIQHLSGGEQRLVGFCLALMNRRPVLLLDEPTNDLDPVHRKMVWDKLQQLNREEGTTIILVTHNVVEAERVLRRVGIIRNGRILTSGSVGELKARVDQNLRLELLFKENGLSQDQQLAMLTSGLEGTCHALDANRWLVLTPKERSQQEINAILTTIGLEHLADFRILLPTLEDVYLQLGGGEPLATTS